MIVCLACLIWKMKYEKRKMKMKNTSMHVVYYYVSNVFRIVLK